MSQSIVVVDAFTDRPFAGNPAAVCILPGQAADGWMQDVAREMNLSETAFLVQDGDGFGLRWFTPTTEVDLCGHATLASAHVVWEEGRVAPDAPARFQTRSGALTCARRGALIEMDFPSVPPSPVPQGDVPSGLEEALGARAASIGRNRLDYLVELDSEQAVRTLRPDIHALSAVAARGVIVTAPASTAGFDFVSRFFAPRAGVPEDPVTGSAHCCLAPFWSARLGRQKLVGYQASARGGTVHVEMQGPRVLLSGQAVTVWRGALLV